MGREAETHRTECLRYLMTFEVVVKLSARAMVSSEGSVGRGFSFGPTHRELFRPQYFPGCLGMTSAPHT